MNKIIVSPSITLKPISMSDAHVIFQTIDSQRDYLGKWLPFVQFTNRVESTEHFIKSIIADMKDKLDFTFVILYEDEFAGLIGFKDTDRINRKTEIGYWLSEPFQKKGIITQSVKALCELAFFELKMNRIQIRVAVNNLPSKKIPQRLGFQLDGIERDGELLAEDNFTDLEIYSLLSKEFEE